MAWSANAACNDLPHYNLLNISSAEIFFLAYTCKTVVQHFYLPTTSVSLAQEMALGD